MYVCFKAFVVTHVVISWPKVSHKGSESEVTQSCPTLQPHGLNLPGSSIHGILQARVLEWVAIPFSRDVGSITGWGT